MNTRHPNKRRPYSLAESIARAIRQHGWDRTDRKELELAIGRPLTQLERKAFCMAADGLNQKTSEVWSHGRPWVGSDPIPFESAIARSLPSRYASTGTMERRYAAIRDNGQKRIRRSKKGRYRLQGSAERSLDGISDQHAARPMDERAHAPAIHYPEANYDEPPVNTTEPHRWYERPYMDTKITRSARGSRYRATIGDSERLQKLKGALPDVTIGQSRYDGHRMPVARPDGADALTDAVNAFLSRGGQIEVVPAGMTGKAYSERLRASEAA